MTAGVNPFSTRFIRPGAIPFVFGDGESAAEIVEKLRASGWWGQIIGNHGTGKSTLLATLAPELEAAGRRALRLAPRQGEHQLPKVDRPGLGAQCMLVIDGYEQLSWWARFKVKALCGRYGAGLLVTAHRDVGLTTVYHTQPSEPVAQQIVSTLLNGATNTVSAGNVSAAYKAANGNVREMLFSLYDVYRADSSSIAQLAQAAAGGERPDIEQPASLHDIELVVQNGR